MNCHCETYITLPEFLLVAVVALVICYYGFVLLRLYTDQYESRREFYFDLILFYSWVSPLVERFKSLPS